MAGSIRRLFGMKKFPRICLLLLFAGTLPSGMGQAGDTPSASGKHQGKLMALSIRIAQAQGNEGKARKYKSLVRQYRVRKKNPAAF